MMLSEKELEIHEQGYWLGLVLLKQETRVGKKLNLVPLELTMALSVETAARRLMVLQ